MYFFVCHSGYCQIYFDRCHSCSSQMIIKSVISLSSYLSVIFLSSKMKRPIFMITWTREKRNIWDSISAFRIISEIENFDSGGKEVAAVVVAVAVPSSCSEAFVRYRPVFYRHGQPVWKDSKNGIWWNIFNYIIITPKL